MDNVGETEGSSAHASEPGQQGASVCCHVTEGGRNLVVNLDGTGNQFGDKNTNVVELYSLIDKGEDSNQLSLYYSGIGTYARPSWTSFSYYKQVIYHKIDLAIAWEFEKTIMGAYSWLSDNYRDGDRIFLLGFSRGAFQVRALSAMIDKVGLLYKGNNTQIPFAYELYADPLSGLDQVNAVGTSGRHAEKMSKADRFKSAFCHRNVKVHFVGAWDTVSSIGLVRKKKLLPGTIDGMKHVCFFRHALALDERRVKFLPEYAYGGTTLPPGHTDPALPPPSDDDHITYWSLLCTFICAVVSLFAIPITFDLVSVPCRLIALYVTFQLSTFVQDVIVLHKGSPFKDPNGSTGNIDQIGPNINADIGVMNNNNDTVSTPQCLEVWFAGTHSDIGGGNVQNMGMDRSRPPLRWMVHEAGALGLRMKPFMRELSSDEHIEIKESLTGLWKILEWLPFRRMTFTGENAREWETYRPHHGAGRVIQPGQKIHGSLTLANRLGKFDGYTPQARLSSTLLAEMKNLKANKDEDFWASLGDERFRDWLEVDLEQHVEGLLRMYISERDAQKEQVLNALKQIPTWTDGRQALYDACIKLLCTMGHTDSPENVTDVKASGNPLDVEESYCLLKIVESLLPESRLRDVKLVPLKDLHARGVAMLLEDEARKREAILFLVRFTKNIMDSVHQVASTPQSIAFSRDGKWLASGHVNGTVWIWDLKNSSHIGKALGHHSNTVSSVAFSPDNKHLASGSWDSTICFWDVEKMKQAGDPCDGHTSWVNSVAFSPDGTKVVSASNDKTLRVWDPYTAKEIAFLEGHGHWVVSAAFSPDGLRITSGSWDKTVRTWNTRTYQQDCEALKGHTDWVRSVAYSPDGRRIATGSDDCTIRIWDAATRVQMGKPLRGHSHFVLSVCFSPDGKLLASGSWDCTIKIWNIDTGEQIGEGLRGHINWVRSVVFSPDGKTLASASDDGTIRMWDIESYVELSLLSIT
ncbi:WD40 repeat-like protein [Agrocybe pediades]|nr:WD40 repeat-like protein [Agrocybe pediades]